MNQQEPKALTRFLILTAALCLTGCQSIVSSRRAIELPGRELQAAIQVKANTNATPLEKLNASAIEQTTYTTGYDAAYVKLD
ncbi:MAG: hypothetical protein ACRD82_01025, partial [Blastocatellia bacterium]